jgi:hypothetical protein
LSSSYITSSYISASYFTASNAFLPEYSGGGTRTLYVDNDGRLTVTFSDIKLKDNIENITDGLEKINMMRPVVFNWKNKNKFGFNKNYGFIAQEIEKIDSSLIFKNTDDLLTFDSVKIIPLMVGAIKDLSVQNDYLYKKLQQLEALLSGSK